MSDETVPTDATEPTTTPVVEPTEATEVVAEPTTEAAV